MMWFGNDKIRFTLKIPFDGSAKATFNNTNPVAAEAFVKQNISHLSYNDSHLKEIHFINADHYRQDI